MTLCAIKPLRHELRSFAADDGVHRCKVMRVKGREQSCTSKIQIGEVFEAFVLSITCFEKGFKPLNPKIFERQLQ
uniref:Uncharacterized protein n=1 Tax=Steinernema glaseri TaxID=37863 RepID=A0A1I8A1I8_9BILA